MYRELVLKTVKLSFICAGFRYVVIFSIVLTMYIQYAKSGDAYNYVILSTLMLISSMLSDRRHLEQFKNALAIVGMSSNAIEKYIIVYGLPRFLLLTIPIAFTMSGLWISLSILIYTAVLYLISKIVAKGLTQFKILLRY